MSEPDNPDTFEGLRRVKIITKDNWFTEDVTWTDDNGCWNVIDSYSGKAWMWVQFSNDRCRIRGTADNWRALWEWTTTVKDFVGCLDRLTLTTYRLIITCGMSRVRKGIDIGSSHVNNAVQIP
ncbi:MAG: hypothetical protein IPL33_22195 [Sphingobacteriales bacterium]|nr:hypothetical protein [Sphingobacteriales bacterium]